MKLSSLLCLSKMRKWTSERFFHIAPLLSTVFFFTLPLSADEGFVPLFNGKDLKGWKSNRDVKKAGSGSFSVNQKEKAIHIYANAKDGEKQPIDCLYSDKEYSNYILKLEYKWMDRRFPPRTTYDRDAGLLFHLHGDLARIWPNCIEMQIGESDAKKTKKRYTTGDLWVIGKDIRLLNRRDNEFYKSAKPLVKIGKNKAYDYSYTMINAEKPHGEWNEITLTVRAGKKAIFDLNGKVLNIVSEMTYVVDGERIPLKKGRIGLQAEYAELLYRNIRIKEIKKEINKSVRH